MKIAIQQKANSFSDRWIEYCVENGIDWKPVDCYSNNIIEQLEDCDALMWHIHQNSPKDNLFAKQLISSVTAGGKKVFPDYNTSWHFDDKLGQKYLFEAIGAPTPETWIFFDKKNASQWISQTRFPVVFKLRGGGASQNVRLVRNRLEAKHLVRKAFGRGFSGYYALGSLKERYRKLRLGETTLLDIVEGIIRFVIPPPYAKNRGRERGYVYFQEYIPGNTYDIRVVVIGTRAFAIKRMVRKDDFRASGSGIILYEKEHFPDETIDMAFKLAERMGTQSAALDFLYRNGKTYVLEVSFGFIKEGYDPCTGYWDRDLSWHEGSFNPYGWMVEDLIRSIEQKST